jgi:Outer membrane protein beta-barrel domain
MGTLRATGFCALLTAVLATSAFAQKAQTREGFWIGFGAGAGSLGFGGDATTDDRQTGLSGNFRLGATVSPHFLIGAETNGWTDETAGITTTAGVFSAMGYYYPMVQSGLYLKAGLGFLAVSDNADIAQGKAAGMAGQLGLGYDVRVSRNMSLSPYMNYIMSTGAELKLDGTPTGVDINPNIFQFGLGLTWH